jgi:hypothetical protein
MFFFQELTILIGLVWKGLLSEQGNIFSKRKRPSYVVPMGR